MEKEELLNLPPVLFAPFLALGTLTAYFGGGFVGGILFALAAAFSILFARKKPKAAVCSAGAALGAAVMLIYVWFYSYPVLRYADKSICSEVKVTEIVQSSGDTRQFVGEISLDNIRANVRLTGESQVEVGDRAVAMIEFESSDPENEIKNLSSGILLSGNVSEYLKVERSSADIFIIIEQLRETMIKRLGSAVFGDEREIALSMFFGKDEGLSQALSEKIKISGVSHFTAVSGAHFAVLASVLLQLFPSKNRRAKALFSFLITPCAIVFFGLTLSVLRSSLMFLIVSAAPLFYRTSNTLNSLCISVCIILTFMPQAILDIGFAMSVLGVFGAGIAGPYIGEKICEFIPKKLKFLAPAVMVFSSSVCAVICTAPVSAAVFKGISLNAAAASILIMPLMTVGMTFTLLLGITGAEIFAVPVDLAVKLIVSVINVFGGSRAAFLDLDFFGAWIFAAICAVLVLIATFGKLKTFLRCTAGILAAASVCVVITLFVNFNRAEIRFVGNSTTSAAIVLCKNEADVFVSGSGVGLADDISRCMREHGAYRIRTLAALDADFCGELALEELSELVDIENIILSRSISGIDAQIADKNAMFSVNGITISSAAVSDIEASADVVLYHGSITRDPQSSAMIGVYFTNTKYELPKNAVNIYKERDYCIALNSGKAEVVIA